MLSPNTANLHDAYAADYDQQTQAYGCHLEEVLFGMCFGQIRVGESLLDAGIGSGLSAALFAKARLTVDGFDFSSEMLRICREKGFARDLKQQDILNVPWQYESAAYDQLVCCGVLHFLAEVEPVFSEAQRVIRHGGWFAFTSKVPEEEIPDRQYEATRVGNFEIYAHQRAYLEGLCQRFRLKIAKTQQALVGTDIFQVWVTCKDNGSKS